MNAPWTISRRRRFLPLLAICCTSLLLPSYARADRLVSRLTDRASLVVSDSHAGNLSAGFAFQAQGQVKESRVRSDRLQRTAFAAATLILVVPAGTMPVVTYVPPPPPPPPPPPQTSTPPDGGGVHTSGSPPPATNPEPGGLLLALTGSGTALLTWMRQRRKRVALIQTA